jgi:hypothetical protein
MADLFDMTESGMPVEEGRGLSVPHGRGSAR